MAVVDTPTRETVSPHDEELLIKEARLRARRRRWIIGLVVLAVIVATAILVGGGKRFPPRSTLAPSPVPARSGVAGGHGVTTPAILGGQVVMSVWPVSTRATWAVTANVVSSTNAGQGVEWTSNAGQTWRNATPPGYNVAGGQHYFGNFFALSARRAWLTVGSLTDSSASRFRLLGTNDAGYTWSIVGTVPSSCTLNFSSADMGVCATSNGAANSAPLALYVTRDGGRTWTKTFDNTSHFTTGGTTDGGLPFECDKVMSLSGPTVWAEFWCNSSVAMLYRSDDAGRTWSAVTLTQPSPVRPDGAEFTGPVVLSGQRGAVAFTEGLTNFVYVTRDGGHSFIPVLAPDSTHPWTVDVVSPTTWHLAYRNQLLTTTDGGTSWTGLTDNAFSFPNIQRSQRYSSGAPATLSFTSPSTGWMSWGNGNGALLMTTRDVGRTWQLVNVPGTGPR